MSSLEGKLINNTYKDLLQISNNNVGIDGTTRYIEDGEGTTSVLGLNTSSVTVSGDILPETNMIHDLGSVTSHWNKIYTHDLWVHGNMGLGVESPAYTLDVAGDINLTGSLKVNGADAVFSNWTVNGSNIYRDTGFVGIGTTNPLTMLHIQDNDTNTNLTSLNTRSITIQDTSLVNDTLSYINFTTSNNFSSAIIGVKNTTNVAGASVRSNIFFANRNDDGTFTEKMTIKPGGNVGIGTTDPIAPLHIYSATPQHNGNQNYYGNLVLQKGYSDNWNRIRFDDANGDAEWGVAVNHQTKFTISRLKPDWGAPGSSTNADDSVLVADLSGNVGIGTSTPTEKLHVSGNIVAVAGNIHVTNGGSASGVGIYSPAANEMGISTNSAEAMRIDSEGTITWGTPSAVGSSFWGVGKISYTKSWDPNSIAYPTIGSGGEGSLIMLDNPHVNYRFDNALSTPSRPFGDTDNASVYGGRAGIRCQIAAKTGSYWDVGLAHVDGDSTANGNEFFVIHKHGSEKPGLVITANNNFVVVGNDIRTCNWNTDGNTRMLVTHADTYVNAYKWAVIGGHGRNQGGALGVWDMRTPGPHDFTKGTFGAIFTSWNMNNTSPYADGLGMCSYTDSSGGGDNLLLISKSSNAIKLSRLGYHDASTQSLSDFNNGSIYTVNVTSASDSRVKEDVQPITDALDKIMQLEPVTYKWTDQYIESGASKNADENIFDDDGNRIMPQTKTTNVGLIAQQVEQVLPTVVHQDRMSLQDETEYLKNIDYEKLVPHLIRAIQEQQARIEALESKLT